MRLKKFSESFRFAGVCYITDPAVSGISQVLSLYIHPVSHHVAFSVLWKWESQNCNTDFKKEVGVKWSGCFYPRKDLVSKGAFALYLCGILTKIWGNIRTFCHLMKNRYNIAPLKLMLRMSSPVGNPGTVLSFILELLFLPSAQRFSLP